VIMSVFAVVNLSLIVIKRRDGKPEMSQFEVPIWVPVTGGLSSAGLVVFQALEFLGLAG